jgi:NAD(P)-dependent dehydrogenase (short-subunit alcohol dehydrogenase family)
MTIRNEQFANLDWDEYLSHVPLGRRGSPADVARLVRWLASDESSYLTGAEIVVDGGLTAGAPTARPRRPTD